MNKTENEPVDYGEVVSRAGVRISWIWVFPVLAAMAVVWLFWSNWKSNGPEIEVRFETAPGMQAGKTLLIYRGVVAGKVTAVRLDRGLDKVVLMVRLKAFAAELAREGTLFWIDQPVVGIGEMSGLDALIQGNSLQARMGDGVPATRFTGVDREPLTPLESPTLILKLRGSNIPFLDRGSPLYYRGVAVGLVEDKALDEKGPYLRVVVDKKFAQTVRSNARFWPVAATSMKISSNGVKLDLLGLKAILLGGVEFDVFGEPGAEVRDETEFVLCADQAAARAESEDTRITLHAKVLPSVCEGAPVLYRGLVAGRVKRKAIDAAGEPFLEVVIQKEFAKTVSRNARFWQVAATSVQAGPGVLDVNVASLETLVQGGVAFDVFGAAEAAAENGSKFELFATESMARATSPPVQIVFENGQGLLAGQTQVRHLGVPVGLVESVIPEDGKVKVIVRLNAGYDFLRREGSAFSIVRLSVSSNGVSGLETVVSGVYIDCVPGEGSRLVENFSGVPLTQATFQEGEKNGLEVVVTASQTDISLEAPVFYRGIIVGKVGRKVLSADGHKVGLCVIINPPYANLIRENTKFWTAGGMKISLGFFSLKVQSASLEALARGALAFATPNNPDMGATVKRGHEFELNAGPRREWLNWKPTISTDH